jgi:hypothetical protein
VLAAGAAPAAAGTAFAAESFPPRVSAVYRITFAGIDIGSFNFQSTLSGQGYTLQSSAELSALLGAFKWKGNSRSTGTVTEQAPKPAAYSFDYRSNSKEGHVKMAFNAAGVSFFNAVPPQDPHPMLVPLKEQHLKDVLDPLSAVMALTRAQGANPCGRRLAIFDGKQRFDLQMSFRRQQKIAEARPTGQPGFAFVCHVRYVPLAGYKPNNETKEMAANSGIEIALRPVPSANLVVPYQVTIPTTMGTAVLTAQRIEIQTQNKGQIALVH